MLRKIFIFTLLLSSCSLKAQDSLRCQDVVYLIGGTILRGTITEYDPASMVHLTTWSGAKMQLPSSGVRKIVQQCRESRQRRGAQQNNFSERGWYHSSRAALLFGDYNNGYSLQHSTGFKINRFLSAGVGIGLENYGPGGVDPVIVPLFAEARGYLLNRRITPFYSIGAGWSFIGKEQKGFNNWGWENNIENWKGGWMAQGQLGYRIGNHFLTYVGIRLQRLTLEWDNSAWGGGFGTDRHLKKRIEFGVGLLL